MMWVGQEGSKKLRRPQILDVCRRLSRQRMLMNEIWGVREKNKPRTTPVFLTSTTGRRIFS
jgi:hypothetical protein